MRRTAGDQRKAKGAGAQIDVAAREHGAPPEATAIGPTLAEFACLGIIAAAPTHGWAIVSLLGSRGDIGRVWSLSRPLTYRAVDGLAEKRLVVRQGHEPGQGPARTKLAITEAGSAACERWLIQPVEHIREVRTVLLLKLAIGARLERDPRPLLLVQREAFAPLMAALGAPQREDNLVNLWRDESSRAVGRFLERAITQGATRSAPNPAIAGSEHNPPEM